MKKSINEIAKFQRLAGLITESEYQETMMKDEAKVEEAKIPVSKDKKIQVLKEWIWYTCDEGQAKDDINKYNKMIDIYFADKDDVTEEDFKKIWAKVTEKYGVGDVGADWDAFPETWNDIQRGRLVNPSMKYEVKEKVEEANEENMNVGRMETISDGRVESGVIDLYKNNYKIEDILKFCKMALDAHIKRVDDYYKNHPKLNEGISSEAFKRMDGLVNRNHVLSLLAAAEGIMGDLDAEGFDVEDIRDYINQIIVNDI